MVTVRIGDLFQSKAQTLVNTVNCVGVMGKGIALGFRKRYPAMYEDYVGRCRRGEVRLGQPYLYKALLPPWILNFPTKDHWRSVARLDSITQGLEYLLSHYREWGITSLAIPPLGCGEGQLEWRVVGPTLYRYLSRLDIAVELYAPYGTPEDQLRPECLAAQARPAVTEQGAAETQRLLPGWIALVEIIRRLEEQPYHWPTGRTLFQKIAYVATEEGLPTDLEYRRGSYGPFAPELKGVLTKLANNGLIRERPLGRMLSIEVGPTFGDARKTYADDLRAWDAAIDRVVDLFLRMNTQQAEIATTVLFAARSLQAMREGQPSERDVLTEVMRWKHRRRPALDESSVATTVRNLAALGWLDVQASQDLPLPLEDAQHA